jgi:RNA polymerase sigma-70 factor (ECF subfamily)
MGSRMELSDETAVAKARAGDADAFRVLVERHSHPLLRLAFRMTGNEQDAEDIVQETLLRAYRRLDKFDERATFRTWLYRIAVNCSLDLVRLRKRRSEFAGPVNPDMDDPLDSVPATAPTPDRMAMSEQARSRIAVALDELSASEKTAFVLRHFEGLCIEDVSRVLECRPGAARHSVFRAVQKLRRALEPLVSTARWSP